MKPRSCLAVVALLAFAAATSATAQQELNFFDDFQGSDLNPAFRVLNPDRQRMALTQGEYLLIAPHRDAKNVIEFAGELPEDFAVTIRVEGPPQRDHQAVQLRAGDFQNGLYYGATIDERWVEGKYGRQFYFYTRKHTEGEPSDEITVRAESMLGSPFYLRMEKRGVEYTGSFSEDGSRWRKIGTQLLIAPQPAIFIDVVAWDAAPETPIKIDSFEISEILN